MKVERLEIGEMKNWRKEKVDILGFLRCSPKANYFAKREGLKNEEGLQYLTFFNLQPSEFQGPSLMNSSKNSDFKVFIVPS